MWKQRWENSNKALIDMAEEKTRSDKEKAGLQNKVSKLENLCRALQQERNKKGGGGSVPLSREGSASPKLEVPPEAEATPPLEATPSLPSKSDPDHPTTSENGVPDGGLDTTSENGGSVDQEAQQGDSNVSPSESTAESLQEALAGVSLEDRGGAPDGVADTSPSELPTSPTEAIETSPDSSEAVEQTPASTTEEADQTTTTTTEAVD